MFFLSRFSTLVLIVLNVLIACDAVDSSPVIGVLAIPSSETNHQKIVASYVKFLQFAGARVLPVFLDKDDQYYKNVVNITNGLLFTGGGVDLRTEDVGSARSLWNHALRANEDGGYYPIFGICLGFELIALLASGGKWPFDLCPSRNKAVDVDFVEDLKETKMFKDASESVLDILEHHNVTYHYHRWCSTQELLKNASLDSFFKVSSTSRDERFEKSISSMEAVNYPIYGLMFHPEKVLFEHFSTKSFSHIPHSAEAVSANQFFGNFFVNEARKSGSQYPEEALLDLIDNECPRFTGLTSPYAQTYFFPREK